MDTAASEIDESGGPENNPDPAIVDFVARSRLVSRGTSARFERLPGGVSSDIWLVHAEGISFCVKRALPRLRVAAAWRAFTAGLHDLRPPQRNLRPTRSFRRSASSLTCWRPRAPIQTVPQLWRDSPRRPRVPS